MVSEARSAAISSCHSVRALSTSVVSEVCTSARSFRSSVTAFGPTVIVTSRLSEACRSAASAHSSALAVDDGAGVDGADVAGDGAGVGVPAPPPLSLDPQPATRSPVASRTAAHRVLMPTSVAPPPYARRHPARMTLPRGGRLVRAPVWRRSGAGQEPVRSR